MALPHRTALGIRITTCLPLCVAMTVFAAETALKEPLVVNVETFGAKGNGVDDDWPAFQRAIDRAAQNTDGGTVIVPSPRSGGAWRLSRALRMKSLVTVQVTKPETRILCMGDAAVVWPETGCVMFGNYTASKLAKVPSYPLAPIAAGDKTVRLQAGTGNPSFSNGEVVVIASSTSFSIGKGADEYQLPTSLQINLVERISRDGQELSLRYPMRSAMPSGILRRLNDSADSQDRSDITSAPRNDKKLWATYAARLIGGSWEAAKGQPIPFAAAGGTLGCTVEPHAVSAYTGVGYGNMYAMCRISAELERISGVAIELAFGSHDNTVKVGQIYMEEAPKGVKTPPWYIGVNEGANNNEISVDYMEVASTGFDVIRLVSAAGNRVTVGNLSGQKIDGFVVRVQNGDFAGTSPTSVMNQIKVNDSSIDSQRGYIVNAAGTSNSVTGKYSGSTVNERK